MTQHRSAAAGGRLYAYDNLKCILMFLVVVGHLLELGGLPRGSAGAWLYQTIYLFHMPAFLFLMGLFARRDRSALRRLGIYLVMYLVFQTLYLCFVRGLLEGEAIALQYTTPYWVLWYLMVMIYYGGIALPVLAMPRAGQWITLALSVIAALLAGYWDAIGGVMALSRAIVFAPFYLAGCILSTRRQEMQSTLQAHRRLSILAGAGLFVGLLGAAVVIWRSGVFSRFMLYESFSYGLAHYDPGTRLLHLFLASLWIVALLLLQACLDWPVPLLSTIGRNTLPVFLLHGFFVKLAGSLGWFRLQGLLGIGLVVLAGGLLLLALGNQWVGTWFSRLFFLQRRESQKSEISKSQP